MAFAENTDGKPDQTPLSHFSAATADLVPGLEEAFWRCGRSEPCGRSRRVALPLKALRIGPVSPMDARRKHEPTLATPERAGTAVYGTDSSVSAYLSLRRVGTQPGSPSDSRCDPNQ